MLYVPNLSYNLLRVSKSTDTIKSIMFASELYYLNCRDTQQATAATHGGGMSQVELWHRRYGHLGVQNMRKLVAEEMLVVLDYTMSKDIGVCERCVEGKHHHAKFDTSGAKHSDSVLGLLHSDVCGEIRTQSMSVSEYFLTFITWVYILKRKDHVFEQFLKWKALAEKWW